MAKVTGPLASFDAVNQFAKTIVYTVWKGICCARLYVIPANPKTAAQGNRRTVLGGTGKAVGQMVKSSAYHQQLLDLGVIPGQQTKQSFIVDRILTSYLTNATTFAAELAELTGHARYTDWGAGATALGLTDFSLAYDSIANYDKALGIYLMAKTAIALGFTGTPYTTALASWATTDIDGFIADLTGA